ncbi:glycosyltransferase [Streptococcus thermophilus]|uniref:glycosyltransferase n=1 Tax=Streptococcus thermophilus TaxID=1308 RepID=UPI001CEFF3AD|nr:glycosyltransferase [Streptococcus thermophilus]MCA6640180.1 multidrug MFS transporter [Streptococcus thermophilus]MCA6643474.1 multidrug MFS transporter [Streptococcus thermophilus]MCA6646763.1 multidrug MFS transporter [Streptococcus thermophilus]
MIFVTVGTHEQPFNRLIQKIDELVRDGEIEDDVFMQIGYSTYEPKYTKWEKFIGYETMERCMNEASTIITHGGPSTYMQVLQLGKIPIVVPRQMKFDEHINDHQIWVSKQVVKKGYSLILCEDVEDILENIISSKISDTLQKNVNHNTEFIKLFSAEIYQLFIKSEKI